MLRARTKEFALAVIRLTRKLPNNPEGWVLGKQLLRSGTSVAANYRAAERARSRAEFAARIGVVLEEPDETVFWLEMVELAGLAAPDLLQPLLADANELLKIFSASFHTVSTKPRTTIP